MLNRLENINSYLCCDSFFPLFSGEVSYKTALSFLEYTKNETEGLAWRAFQHNIKHVKDMLKNTLAYEGFKVRRYETACNAVTRLDLKPFSIAYYFS